MPVLTNPHRFGSGPMAYTLTVLADNPIMYWRLGEASGTTAEDATANNRDGTYTNTPTLGSTSLLTNDLGASDTCITVGENTGQCVSIASAAWMNVNAITVECWVNMTSEFDGTNGDALVSRYNTGGFNWLLWRNTSGRIAAQVRNTGGTAVNVEHGSGVSLNTTYYAAFTFDGTTVRLYVNGVEVDTEPLSGNLQTGTSNLEAARYSAANSTTPGMRIDEVAVYDTALSAARILAHYEAGS